MGKFFSKPVGNGVPFLAPDVNTGTSSSQPPSSRGDISNTTSAAQNGSGPRQALPIRNTNSKHMTNTSLRDDVSPTDTSFSAADHDESTVYEPGGSLRSRIVSNKVLPSKHTRAFSLDSSLPEIRPNPETGCAVYRVGSFGGKNAVQILCDHVLEVLQQAVDTSPLIQNGETGISHASWIMEPYDMIIHNKVKIEEHRNGHNDGITKKHLNTLLEFLESNEPGAWEKFDEVQLGTCQKVLFKHLWLLYTPRTTVFRLDGGAWRAYRIETTETVLTKTTVLRIYAWFLDFNDTGTRLIPHREIFEVPSFSSERSIRKLELIPDWFIKHRDTFCQQLLDRGRLHWRYNSQAHYQEYRGKDWPHGPHSSSLKVIVDYSTSTRCNVAEDVIVKQNNIASCTPCIGTGIGLKSYPSNGFEGTHSCINHPLPKLFSSDVQEETDDSTLLFCPPKLWAFSLKFKTWKTVSHDKLDTIHPQSTFFKDELYMDEKRKDALDQIVGAHMSRVKLTGNNKSFDRKSRGLNILLVGSSGTGKTFTAECISKRYGIALYTVSCGDLGVQPDLLDQKLLETFTRATNWNAMVLLDDVDFYGFDRTGHMYKRAALLPTFLRHLEYSECLTFITMANADVEKSTDEALHSRIHAVVPFPKFNAMSQREIWQRFILSLPNDCVDLASLLRFVQHDLSSLDGGKHMDMNAWQIRNCIDVALTLAEDDATSEHVLKKEHVLTVLGLREAFRAHVLQDRRKEFQDNEDFLRHNPDDPLSTGFFRNTP